VGRPHLASVLQKKGWVGSLREAFDKYLGEDRPAYVAKYKQSPYQAIDLIRRSGGVAVLAHPVVTQKDELIGSFVEAGLKGLEVYYPNVPMVVINHYENIARKHNLIMTGGSDAHGSAKGNTFIGKVKIPYEVVEQLRQAAQNKF
jgi:predicted metal-dependent phosphoesterase TrpH